MAPLPSTAQSGGSDATSGAASSVERTLDAPNDPAFNEVLGINDRGDIVDTAGSGTPLGAYVVPAPYNQRDFTKIAFAGSAGTAVTAVNNAGTIVGYYVDARGNTAAFMKQNGRWTHYAGPGPSSVTKYLGINDAGVRVGFYTNRHGVNVGFEIGPKSGDLLRIRPPGSASVTPSGINDQGEVVGSMTTARGLVEGFLSQGGSFVEFSYPRAVETRALGINRQGEIVGSYLDGAGTTHGFVLRDVASTPRWQSVDALKADRFTVLTGINVHGDIVGYYRDDLLHVRALLRPALQPPPPGAPLVIPRWGQGGDVLGGGQDANPGPIPDRHLYAVIMSTGSETSKYLASSCPGVSSTSTCQPFKYINFLRDYCATPVTRAAYQWADNNDENGFLHIYPGAKTLSNRLSDGTNQSRFGNCKQNNPDSVMPMNPGDSGLNAYLYNNVWNGSNYTNDFPSPYGAMEDNALVLAWRIVGDGKGGPVSTEYGSGTTPSGFADQVGDSSYHDAMDFETGLGTFVNGACAGKCVDMALNGVSTGAGNIGSCSVIRDGHCHVPGSAGIIDDQASIDNICATVTGGNLKYFMAERPIFAGRFGFEFLNSQTIVDGINTNANLYTHTADGCANTKIVEIETGFGEGGPGDVTGGYRVRLAALAWRWLVANPATGVPDRVISDTLTEGGTAAEVPYFFEDTLVPYGAEISVPKFVWNGKMQTIGGGCPSTSGDSGGAIALLVKCVGPAGIYCQQYAHLYINGADYGATAACFNTSTTSENVVGSWFMHDPISSYRYQLSLRGGEMTSVPYRGVSQGSISLPTCTSKSYCTGSNTLSSQAAPFAGNGSDTLCGQCGVILLGEK